MPELSLPQQIARLDLDRLKRYTDALNFYNARQWAGAPRRRERQLTFNYARAVVDKTASYVLTGLDFAVDPEAVALDGQQATGGGGGSPRTRTEALARAARTEDALRRVWEDNDLDQLDFDSEIDCAVLGDGAYKVTWEDEHGGNTGQGTGDRGRVRVTAPDVQGLYAWWRGDDLTGIRRVAQRWQSTADELAGTLGIHLASRRADGAVSVIEDWTATSFDLWVDDQLVDSRSNPYGFIPYVLYPNIRKAKAFWGVSDLDPIIEPQRELNRALSQLSMILELSGNPIAVLENVTDSTDIAVQPGAVWELPQDARAYLLDLLNGGVRLHIDYVDTIYRTLHDLAETPRTAFGENRQGLSGVALNTELDPLLKKVNRKRLIRGAAFRRRNELILRLLAQFTGEDFAPYRSRIVWGQVLPQDRSRIVADERQLVAAGIHSRHRAADTLGVEDPDAEFARWLDEERVVHASGIEGGAGRATAEEAV